MESAAFLGEEQSPAYKVLLELAFLLQDYKDDVVLVGGWCAYLLATHYAEHGPEHHHIGSNDVDLLFNVSGLLPNGMREIRQALVREGYREDPNHAAFRLVREFDGGSKARVLVDLMVPDTSWPRRPRALERGLWVMTLDGGHLTTRYTLPVVLRGRLPSGRSVEVTLNVMGFPAFLALKGITLGDRKTKGHLAKYQKNAYDIAFVIDACGPHRVAAATREARDETDGCEHEELMRGLSEIHTAFESREAGGADAAAVVYSPADPDLRPGYARRAFESVADFLQALGYPVRR